MTKSGGQFALASRTPIQGELVPFVFPLVIYTHGRRFLSRHLVILQNNAEQISGPWSEWTRV